MAAPKCRIDVWQPTILTVATTGATATAQRPAAWVKCDTVTDVTTENPPGPNPNLRRANACTSVEIKDEMFSPRAAYISIVNRPQDFTAFDDDTMETQHQDSDGNEIQIGGSDVKTRIRRNWGPFSYFFKEFQQIRIVDLETHLVLFTGRIYKVSKKHDGQRGATVELVCKDALEELRNISMKTMPKELHFAAETPRSTVVQSLLNLGFNYEASLPSGGPNKNQNTPVTTVLSSATLAVNSNDASASAGANGFNRFELSATAPETVTKLKTRKTGSRHLLSELTRWAILEPHEDETAENQFGYDFFVDSNIGSDNLLATTAPPPSMFNYFKRGNRLSAAGSAGQDADTYGLTCILPTVARATHTGLQQRNVGVTAASGSNTAETFLVDTGHSLYPGQLITIGSETMYVKFTSTDENILPDETVHVVRGWGGSTPASFVADVVIKENRPATAVMQKDTSSFDDAKDELFTECDLTYETSYTTGGGKLGTREKTKKFEIMFVSYLTGDFAWSGLDFDDEGKGSDDDDPGLDSAEILTAYREDESTVYASNIGRIQYQSTSTVTGAANFAYIMLSDVSGLPTSNYGSEDYVVLKGGQTGGSGIKCRLDLGATEVQQGRPSTAFAEGTTRFKRVFTMTKETHDNIDDIRQEIAARLGQSTIAMKRGDFTVSKAPYYWADFKVRSIVGDGGTGGQILTVKSDNGTAAVKVTNYGFREGMLTHKRADANNNPDYGYIATANGNDVYGYCYSLTADDTLRVKLTESQTFAVDDAIRLYIPIRAGEAIFVDHILANVYGEHLTTSVSFNEMPVPTTSYSTIGENEPRIRMRVGSVNKQNIWNSIAIDRLEASEREHNNLPKGTQTFSFSGTWSYPAANIVQWTAGDLRTADGEVYQIAASNTSDTTYGLGSSGMTGSNDYTVYVDPEGENPSGNIYHLYTVISTSYLEDDDNIVVLKTSVGAIAGKANAIAGPNMDLTKTDTPKWEAFVFAHDESVTADLVKAGTLTGNKLVNNTITVTQIGDNAISTAKIQANAITANEIVTNAITSNKIVAGAIIAAKIATNAITADKISAGEITAEKIASNTITTNQLNFTPNTDSTASIRAVAAGTSGTIAGLKLSASTFFMGTGHFGLSNTPFFVRGLDGTDGNSHVGTAGDFSLGDKFVWDNSAETLAIDGTLSFGGTCTISSTGITFPNAANDSNGGIIKWSYGGNDTFLYRTSNGNQLNFYYNGGNTVTGEMRLLAMSLALLNGGDYYYGTTSLAPLYGGSSTDAQSLHTHGNLGGGSGSGDITAVVAGTGLTGGATSGSATLAIDYSSNNTWTGVQTFNGGYSTFNTTVNIDGGSTFLDVDSGAILNCTEPSQFEAGLYFKEISTPGTPSSTWGRLYIKASGSTNKLYYKDDAGTETDLIAGGGGSGNTGTANTWTAVQTFEDPTVHEMGMTLKHEATVTIPASGHIRLYEASDVLKYRKSNGDIISISTSAGGAVETGREAFLAVYKDNPSGDNSTTVEGINSLTGSTVLGWKTVGAGKLVPASHGVNGLGDLYQGSADTGVKYISARHDAPAGDPPYSFSQKPSTGMSYREISGGANVCFETNDTDIITIGLFGMKIWGSRGFTPSTNNSGWIGSQQTNLYSYSVQNDRRFILGAFNDISTTGSIWMHYGDYGESNYLEESQLHVKPAMFYEFASTNSQTSVDLVVQTYNNEDRYRVARESSTIRNKENVRDIEVNTEKIYDLVPRTFEWKNSGETAFGLIAEEVDEVIPALVTRWAEPVLDENGIPSEDGDPIPQGVDYKRIAVLVLTEMKKLKERIDVLEGS